MLLKTELDKIEQNIIKTLSNEVKEIISKTNENMVIVEEKSDGDLATVTDIKISEILGNLLPQLLPNSIVIQRKF